MILKKIAPVPSRTSWKSVLADDARLLDLAVRLAAIAFLFDDLIEFRTYIRSLRIFLPSPILPIVNDLPLWSDWGFWALHTCGLILLIWRPRLQYAAVLVVSITVLCVLSDVTHAQPFTMMYAFTILMAALPRISTENRLQALRVMIVGVYFWAGFNKLNNAFYAKIFPWFMSPFWDYPPDYPLINSVVSGTSLLVPVFEALIGLFLLFERTRLLATAMAAIMLVVVLACLGPFGHNWAMRVWPWNLYLFAMEFYLFVAPHENCLVSLWESWPVRIAAVIFIVAPIFGIWGLWDDGPSFKLYSGNVVDAYIMLDKREDVARLPEAIRLSDEYIQRPRQDRMCIIGDSHIVPVYDWAAPVKISTIYPSEYVFKTGAKGLCPYLQYPATAILRINYPGEFDSLHARRTGEPLCPLAAQ